MKKIIVVMSLVLVVGLFSAFSYADSPIVNEDFKMGRFGNRERVQLDVNSEEFKEWKEDRIEYRKENLKKAVEEKLITEEEAKIWEEHFQYMDEFHEKNGYLGGNCGGSPRKQGNRRGMGRHHMGW